MIRRFFHPWKKAALINGFQDATAYRLDFLFEILGSALVPVLIQVVLWWSMFKVEGNTTIAGMTFSQMLSYTLASMLFSQVRGGNHDFELAEMIRDGSLSNYLLRPVGVVEFVYIRGVAARLLISMICLCVGLVVAAFTGHSIAGMLLGMGLALLGNLIHYQIGAAMAALAFYWEEAHAILMVKNLCVSLLSGELIPLTLFPENVTWIWKSLPFYLYVFGPAQIALGAWGADEILHAYGMALLWVGVGAVLIRVSWGLGMRRYSAIGG